MASRMDRYKTEAGRSVRNQDIYKELEELGTYTNIEGIASIQDNNEIDISKIKEMLKNRENYQKEKRIKDLLGSEEKEEVKFEQQIEEEKNYDIKDILDEALKKRSVYDNDNHKFESSKYDILKEILVKKNNSEEEKKELENNLLDNLIDDKKEEQTDVDIKKVISEAKEPTEEMDKSFFTNSLSLTSSDFENLKEIQTDIKRNNRLLKVVSFILAIIVVIILVFIIIK